MSRIIVDVREPLEFAAGHLDGALNVPLHQLPAAVQNNDLSSDDEIVVYCNSGNRSAQAQQFLEANGFRDVTNGINQSHVEQEFC